jgi:hypothetical protein
MRVVTDQQLLSVLAVCVPELAGDGDERLQVWSVDSATGALAVLRTIGVGLLVAGTRVPPDGAPWAMIRRVRGACPWQKWALVAPQLCEADEVVARTLGVARIFDAVPTADDLLRLAGSTGNGPRHTLETLSLPNGQGRRDLSPRRPRLPVVERDPATPRRTTAARPNGLTLPLSPSEPSRANGAPNPVARGPRAEGQRD